MKKPECVAHSGFLQLTKKVWFIVRSKIVSMRESITETCAGLSGSQVHGDCLFGYFHVAALAVAPLVVAGGHLVVVVGVADAHHLLPGLLVLVPAYGFVLHDALLVVVFEVVLQVVGQQVVVVLVDALAYLQSVDFFRIVNKVVVLEGKCAYTQCQEQGGHDQFL